MCSESTEYSDWEPDGINLQPPKRRSQRHVKRRRWSPLDGSDSSDAEDDRGKAKVKVESDDQEFGRKSLRKRNMTRSQTKIAAGKQRKQVCKLLSLIVLCFRSSKWLRHWTCDEHVAGSTSSCCGGGYWHQRADERLGDSPQGTTRSIQWSKTGMENLVVHCFCVCSSSALLGDLLGASWSLLHLNFDIMHSLVMKACVK